MYPSSVGGRFVAHLPTEDSQVEVKVQVVSRSCPVRRETFLYVFKAAPLYVFKAAPQGRSRRRLGGTPTRSRP
jgi:hypothetical protein